MKIIKRYKFVKQDNITDCGVACLLSIIKMYGGNNSLTYLRDLTKTTNQGTDAYHLIEAAKKLGFKAEGYRFDLLSNIPTPAIAHLIIDKSYHHYVVIIKINYVKRIITVGDPAVGIKKYHFEEFIELWSKVIITLKPIKKIAYLNPDRPLLGLIKNLMLPHFKSLIVILGLSILFIMFNIINTWYLKIIADNIYWQPKSLYYLFLFFSLIVLLKISSDFIRNKLLIYINKKVDKELMVKTYHQLIFLPYQYYHSRQTGDIIARLYDLSYVREFISRLSMMILVDFMLIIFALVVLYFINHLLFFISLLIVLLYLVIVLIYNPLIKDYIVKNQENHALVTSYLVEAISGIDTVKGLSIENIVLKKAKDKYNKLIDNHFHFDNLYNRQQNLKNLIIFIGFNLILLSGSFLIYYQQISLSQLILFNSLLLYFLEPIKNIFDLEPLIKNAFNSLKRINELYEVKAEEKVGLKERLLGDIIFNKLSFSYDDFKQVFKDIDLTINQGEKVLITGKSGSGKSTLAKILFRYYLVSDKMISINNKDINEYNLKSIRDNICYVSQHEIIFTDSIYNNLILDRKLKLKEIYKISKLTYVDEILKERHLDFNYLIEENGTNISGGEKQRIIIARSLLKKADIYIFDETMNEISVELERKILKNIFKIFKDKIIIVMSHRLTNSDLFDKQLILDNKKLINIIKNERS